MSAVSAVSACRPCPPCRSCVGCVGCVGRAANGSVASAKAGSTPFSVASSSYARTSRWLCSTNRSARAREKTPFHFAGNEMPGRPVSTTGRGPTQRWTSSIRSSATGPIVDTRTASGGSCRSRSTIASTVSAAGGADARCASRSSSPRNAARSWAMLAVRGVSTTRSSSDQAAGAADSRWAPHFAKESVSTMPTTSLLAGPCAGVPLTRRCGAASRAERARRA